ncbi:MAG: peroxiredoxin [Myxococcota bacterium]|nr:peroxiredoxin [Myxococcota bacterium]
MVALNTAAPSFRLKSNQDEFVSLTDFQGKTVILAFYPAAFTGICTDEMCTFRDNLNVLSSANASVLGISVDGPHANAAFAAQHNLPFPLLSDIDRSTTQAYGTAFPNFAGIEGYTVSNRAVFIVDGEGYVRYAWIGEHPGKQPDYDEVKAFAASLA